MASEAISVTGVPSDDAFSACVTSDGLLGKFTGEVGGQHLDLELIRYLLSTDPTAFDEPRGA